MGYYLHITRARFWDESDELPISLEEWRNYIANDSEIEDPVYTDETGELEVTWFGFGGVPDDTEGAGWFCWRGGQIETKNADEANMRKMIQIAVALNARLLGDEGEEYRDNGEIWVYKYVDKPPELFQRIYSWWTGTPLPERKSDWVMVGRWDDNSY
jgi:hypothetical protein